MSVVTVTEVVPARLEGIVEFMRGRVINEEDLRATMSPPSLRGAEETTIQRVLTACRDLGLFEQVDSGFRALQELTNRDEIRDFLETAIFDGGRRNTKQENVARAIAWFLTLDPARPLQIAESWPVEIRRDCGGDDLEISNLGRVQQFAYWAVYLGFAWRLSVPAAQQTSHYIMPDPTTALERHLRKALTPGVRLAIGETLTRVAERCPVFETGHIREEIDALVAQVRPREENTMSAATSFAFERLQDRGVIALELVDDAVTYTFTRPEQITYTHVTLQTED